MHKFNTSFVFHFLYSWIDVLDLNQPFNWRVEIWEPFKMELKWGLQSWTLVGQSVGSRLAGWLPVSERLPLPLIMWLPQRPCRLPGALFTPHLLSLSFPFLSFAKVTFSSPVQPMAPLPPVFRIQVFNALQTRFGPSNHTSLQTTLENTIPNCKMKTSSLEDLNIIYPPQEPISVWHCHHKKCS